MSIAHFVRPASRARILAGDVPDYITANGRARYIVACILSCPPWVDRQALMRLRDRARCLSEMTGVPHELDHVVPVNHPRVCGLTVPWNLEIKTRASNAAKSNHWRSDWDQQLELWT